MPEMQNSFSQELLEKLIPGARKPLSDITLTMMAPGIEAVDKARLKMALQKCWAQCHSRIDHRPFCDETNIVEFSKLTHYIAKPAIGEFERQKVLYNQYFTVGLKERVDEFAQSCSAEEALCKYDVSPWRLGSSNVCDFRRKNGERLLLISQVKLVSSDGETKVVGKTSDMSKGGTLLLVDPEQGEQLVLLDTVVVEFVELAKKYALEKRFIEYQIVDLSPSIDAYRVALRRTNSGDSIEFEQLLQHLMHEHKRRNRLDVGNTIKALSARSHNMASIAQLNSLMVMSNRKNRYHLLVSQGHTLSLQGELLLSEHLIPQMVEQTDKGDCKQFFVWAYSQNEVFLADLDSMAQKGAFESNLKVWGNAPWHKSFMVKAEKMDGQLADLGTSIPANVSPVADKLNAPLPAKVAKFVQELSKISLIEDVSYIMDGITPPPAKGIEGRRRLSQFAITNSVGRLRQIPFNIKELPDFHGTYRFSHDCELSHEKKSFKIVNGHADCRDAVVSLPLKNHKLPKGAKVSITWNIGETRISIDATVTGYDQLHKRVALNFEDNPQMVKQLFKELENLKAFYPAFIEDVQANKLDVAVRNLVLVNLPKVSIFTQAKKQAMVLTALTGHQHLPKRFIDASTEVKLDELFSQQILLKLASSSKHNKEILFVSVDGHKVAERRLLSEFTSPKLMLKVLQHLSKTSQLYVFSLDINQTRLTAQDDIIRIENKYLKHYSPGKAKKLEDSLTFNLSIQLVDISKTFNSFINKY